MNIGMVAHDAKKKLLESFCVAYKGILCKHDIFATGTTGRMIEDATGLSIHKYNAGHLGGQQQMCVMIENNEMDMIIYLRDPQTAKSHETSVFDIFTLCDSHNIPFATNIATAELLVKALDRGDLDWRELYKN